jgi:hypothetical protein
MSDPDPTARWRRVEALIRHAEDDARIAGSCIALDPPAVISSNSMADTK